MNISNMLTFIYAMVNMTLNRWCEITWQTEDPWNKVVHHVSRKIFLSYFKTLFSFLQTWFSIIYYCSWTMENKADFKHLLSSVKFVVYFREKLFQEAQKYNQFSQRVVIDVANIYEEILCYANLHKCVISS